MKKMMLFAGIFFCLNIAEATNVDIQGTIAKDGGGAIAQARVSLKKYPFIMCYSDQSGAFKLKGNTDVSIRETRKIIGLFPEINGIVVRSSKNESGLIVRAAGAKTNVRIDLFKTNGRKIASEYLSNAGSTDHFIPLTHALNDVFLVKILIDNDSRFFKIVPGMGISYDISSGQSAAMPEKTAFAKQAASTNDSIVIVADGYKNKLINIQSYQQNNIAVSLAASHPWVPGSIQKEGGMVKIMAKGYAFEMGQPCNAIRGIYFEDPTTANEQPVHTVTFTHDFWMDTAEVGQGNYDSLMKITYANNKKPYVTPAWNSSNGVGKQVASYLLVWADAVLYCNARSKAQKLPDTAYSYDSIFGTPGLVACSLSNVSVKLYTNAYRLPTEAEWEYAAKAGGSSDYYWGKSFDNYKYDTILTAAKFNEVDGYAVWARNSANLSKDSPDYGIHKTGTKLPNNYGLYDMAGNVSEWCNDWFGSYSWGTVTDPNGPEFGDYHILRGGNWSNIISYLRSAERQFTCRDYQFFGMGFRVVRPVIN
jgi:formylglycine-generating enzyme required for sulfatase activity